MVFSRAIAITLRHYYLMHGNFARVMPLFAWVAVDMVMWGFMTRYLNSVAAAGYDFIPVLLGGVLLWDFFIRVMQGVTMAFLEDVWSRNFLNIFATPITLTEYIGGLVMSSIATSAVGLVVMALLANLVFGLSFAYYGAAIVPFMLALFMTGIALGILASALVLRFGPASEWFVWPIPAIISPFVGVFYPLSILPGWMHGISYLLPPTYVFEGLRIVATRGYIAPVFMPAVVWRIVVGIGLSAIYIMLAARVFGWTYRYTVRRGILARYSAESSN